ncbi:MAG: contractile injection system protein, VgrG/Pvc8 family [bacterium]
MLGSSSYAVDTDVDIVFTLEVGTTGSLAALSSAELKGLTSVSVTQESDGLSSFAIDFEIWDGKAGTPTVIADGTFDVDKMVDISMGRSSSNALMGGVVTDISVSYQQGGVSLSVTGYDVRNRLRKGRYVRVFDSKTALEIAQSICKDRGLATKVEQGSETLEPVFEYQDAEESDYEYIQRLLGEVGYVIDVEGSTVVFRQPTPPPFVFETYTPITMQSFSASASTLEQVDGVRVISKLPDRKRVVGTAGEPEGDDVITLIRSTVSQAEAKTIADNELKSRLAKKVTASATVRGDAKLIPGGWVQIKDVPKFAAAQYRIKRAVHTWSAGAGYTTALTLEQEA